MENETYKGLVIEYHQDENVESPSEWGDDGVFLVANHRDFYVKPPNTKREDRWDMESVYEEYKKTHHVFGLEAYIHSGVVLAIENEGNFVDRQWDVSQLGLVFVAKSEKRLRSSAKKLAVGLIKEWNMYLGGEVYGYVIKDTGLDNAMDSCWGFYGSDAVREGAREQADYIHDQIIRKHEEKKRAEIIHRVPLCYRTSLKLRV